MTKKVTIEQYRADQYVRDERVNRVMSPARVSRLRANLDLDGIGVFIVSKRKNGDLVLLDGAHRDTALIEEGFGDVEVPAVVHHNLTEAEEAKLFLIYNDRLAVDILQRFRIQVTAEDPESVILDEVIRKAGFLPVGGAENGLTCIGSVQSIYRGGSSTGREAHKQDLTDTLDIIAEAWGTSGSAMKETVKGIGGLLLNHNGDVDQAHMIKALRETVTGPQAIRVKAHYHTREGGKTARNGAELAVAEIYNKGRSQKIKV